MNNHHKREKHFKAMDKRKVQKHQVAVKRNKELEKKGEANNDLEKLSRYLSD